MDPNIPPIGQPQAEPKPQNPYSFILDAEHQKKKPLLSGSPFKSRLLAILGGGTVLIIIVIIASSLFFGGRSNNAQMLIELGAEQQEIIRVSELGLKSAVDPTTLAFAQTTKSSVQTHHVKLIGYLVSKNIKVNPAALKTKLDKTTDTELATAAATNRFDETLSTTLKDMLTSYAASIKKNFNNASNETSKKLLSESYESVEQLLK